MSEPSPAPESGAAGGAPPGSPPDPRDAPSGPIKEDAQKVLDAARAAAQSYFGGFTTLRRLFAAEVSLARDALIHALMYVLIATVMLGTAYLLLTALLVSGLRALGAPWPLALAVPLVISVAVAWFGIVRAGAALRHADFEATRRQLKLGLKVSSNEETPL
jgi:uncharacterized membrane protein YqjE